LLESVEGPEDLLMEFHQVGTGLAETAVGFGQATPAGQVGSGEGAQAGFAGLAPREDGGGVERAFRRRAVTRRFTAAGLQLVDGAFEQLARGKEVAQTAAILLLQLGEKRSLATGLL
jgi:hypothetical protein